MRCAKPHVMKTLQANQWPFNKLDLGCAPIGAPVPQAPTDLRTIQLPANWNTLVTLQLNEGNTEYLPDLPPTLVDLLVEKNKLLALPALPEGLRSLRVSHNTLTTIPPLPSTLRQLDIEHNEVKVLTGFPAELLLLSAKHNELTEVGSLAETQVISVGLGSNNLTKLPIFPQTLERLGLPDNKIEEIRGLPDTVQVLNCSKNPIKTMRIDNLVDVTTLIASNCGLRELPLLPLTRGFINEQRADQIEDDREYMFKNNPLSPEFQAIYEDYLAAYNPQTYRLQDGTQSFQRRRPGSAREFREAILQEHRRLAVERMSTLQALQKTFKGPQKGTTQADDLRRKALQGNFSPTDLIASFLTGKTGTLERQKLEVLQNKEDLGYSPAGTVQAAKERIQEAIERGDEPDATDQNILLGKRAKLYGGAEGKQRNITPRKRKNSTKRKTRKH